MTGIELIVLAIGFALSAAVMVIAKMPNQPPWMSITMACMMLPGLLRFCRPLKRARVSCASFPPAYAGG